MSDLHADWARFAEATASRRPLPFFDIAMDATDGDHGGGRLAIDLGCGAGVETLALLERGWRVFAMDSEPRAIEVLADRVPESHQANLQTAVGRFTDVDLPKADLVYASLSLPFAVNDFDASIDAALSAVRPGGWFVGVLLGANDTWADEVATVDRSELNRLFSGFENLSIDAQEFDGDSGAGPKHWHWYVIRALRPVP